MRFFPEIRRERDADPRRENREKYTEKEREWNKREERKREGRREQQRCISVQRSIHRVEVNARPYSGPRKEREGRRVCGNRERKRGQRESAPRSWREGGREAARVREGGVRQGGGHTQARNGKK